MSDNDTPVTTTGPINLSKSGRKKLERLERLQQNLRQKRKERKKAAATRRRLKREADDPQQSEEVNANHVCKREKKRLQQERLKLGLLKGQRVAIDFQYDGLMSQKELIHLASQIRRVYGANRCSLTPAHLYLTNMSKDSSSYAVCRQKNEGFDSYVLERSGQALTKLFKLEELIYLSPDAAEPLMEIDSSKVYVIGGLSDDSVKKKSSMDYALGENIKTARLPIAEFCVKEKCGSFKQILTVNVVFELLVKFIECGSWSETFSQILPKRLGWRVKSHSS